MQVKQSVILQELRIQNENFICYAVQRKLIYLLIYRPKLLPYLDKVKAN